MHDDGFAETQDRVLRVVTRASAGRAVGVDQDLRSDLGLESIVLMSIAFRLEKEFDVDVTQYGDEVAQLRTVAEIARFFHRVVHERA
jgi:acyl carrier protein